STQPSDCPDGFDANTTQVIAGPAQYHGSQGYEADVIDPQREQNLPPMGRSTGFMHVGCRYYEPAVGRFLEYDPLPIDPGAITRGQHNRWTYCANDPINHADPSGRSAISIGLLAGEEATGAWEVLGGAFIFGIELFVLAAIAAALIYLIYTLFFSSYCSSPAK